MKIIFKFVIKNIWEKKFRTCLILLSIIISAALFFASNAISTTFSGSIITRMSAAYGNGDIGISASSDSPSMFFKTYKLDQYSNDIEYSVGIVDATAIYKHNKKENVNLIAQGMKYDEAQTINPFNIIEEDGLLPFNGKKIILGQSFVEEYGYKVGDFVTIDILGENRNFKISGVAQDTGYFTYDPNNIFAIIPQHTMAAFYGVNSSVTRVYLKAKNPEKVDALIEKIQDDYKNYTVKRPFSEKEIEQMLNSIKIPFMLMTFLVALISIFIIFSSFRVITIERLPVIGTFRSVGATKKTTNFVMFTESFIYGILGGFLGCLIGIGILNIMSKMMASTMGEGIAIEVKFTITQLLGGFLFAIAICLFSSIVPIFKTSKIPLKDIVLNTYEKVNLKKHKQLYIGLALLLLCLILPPITPISMSLMTDTILMLLGIVSIILLIPYIANVFVKLFEAILGKIFGNIGLLAAKNLRENKSILNNISLLAIGIATLFFINIISSSVGIEVANVYSKANYEIWMSHNMDRNFIKKVISIDGVNDVYGTSEIQNVEIVGEKQSIMNIEGIENDQFFEYWDLDIQNKKEIINKLNSGRYILITNTLKNSLAVEKGDAITLLIKEKEKKYIVEGFFNTMMYNGSYALVSKKQLSLDTGNRNYAQLYIKTYKAASYVEEEIKRKFSREEPWLMTMDEMEKENMDSNTQMMMILQGFSLLALLIGIIGVVNNLIISFIQRKRSLAIFKSVGMEKKQVMLMMFIEAMLGGLIGGIVGLLNGLLLLKSVTYVLVAANLDIALHYSAITMIVAVLAGIIIQLLASIGPTFKGSKLNIIEAIKYE